MRLSFKNISTDLKAQLLHYFKMLLGVSKEHSKKVQFNKRQRWYLGMRQSDDTRLLSLCTHHRRLGTRLLWTPKSLDT